MKRIIVVDERCRITLGTKRVSPGDSYRVTKDGEGIIRLFPIELPEEFDEGS